VLKANKDKVEYGGSVTLTWKSENTKADTAHLSGFGDVPKNEGKFAYNVSRTDKNLTHDKTYTLTVKGENGKTVTCKTSVNVKPKSVTPPQHCPSGYTGTYPNCVPPATDVCPNLSGVQTSVPSGYKLENGKCVVVTTPPPPVTDVCPNLSGVQTSVPTGYNIENNQCVAVITQVTCPTGSVLTGNVCVVNVNNNTNNNQNVNNNNVIVNVQGSTNTNNDNDNNDLSCRLGASRDYIQSGDTVRINWSSEDAERGYISNSIGWIDEDDLDSGSENVRLYNTTTFYGTFYDEDGDTERCSVTVNVQNHPVYYPPQIPYVTLSSVPYTGLEMGPVGTAIYWSFLVLWTLVAAYLIAVKKVHYAIARRFKSFLFGSNESDVAPAQAVDMATLTQIVRAIVDGPAAHTPVYRTTAPSVTTDATDEFVLSQIHRN